MLTLNQINNIIDTKVTCNMSNKIFYVFRNKCFIYSFITNFYKCNEELDKSTFIVALIYIQRYNQVRKLTSTNIKPVLETCLILANKYCTDFEIKDSGPLEIHLLNTINWNLYITEEDFLHYENIILKFSNTNFL